MRPKDLKQIPRETMVEFISQINDIAYQCGIAFPLEDKISTFMFGLQSAIQTIVAQKTIGLDDRGRPFDNVIRIT